MKKIYTLLVMVFAFSMSSNAQSEKLTLTAAAKAKANLYDLTMAMDIGDDQLRMSLYDLFVQKQMNLERVGITAAEKQAVYNDIDGKLKATFTEQQILTLKSKPGLYESFITEAPNKTKLD